MKAKSSYKIRINLIFLGFLSVFLFISFFVYTAKSDINGKTGKTSTTSTGCSCHGGTSSNVTFTVTSKRNWKMAPGAKDTLLITMFHSTLKTAGINAAIKTTLTGEVNIGTITNIAPNTKISNGELTHSTPGNIISGSTVYPFIWTAPSTEGTYYLRVCGLAANKDSLVGGDQWAWMVPQPITVKIPSSITITNSDIGSVCQLQTRTLSWSKVNVNKVKILLSNDNGVNYNYTILDSIPADSLKYVWTLSNNTPTGPTMKFKLQALEDSTVFVVSSTFSIIPNIKIQKQPQSQSLCKGLPVTFSVLTDAPSVTYQWKHNGVNIQGETNPSFYISKITELDSGSYECILTGYCGEVNSQVAKLTVNNLPEVISCSKSAAHCLGDSVVLNVAATGTTIKYQWRKNGVNLTGAQAKTNTFKIVNYSENDAGMYDCIITGKCPPEASTGVIELTVNPKTIITTHPVSQSIQENTTLNLSVSSQGNKLNYQWRKDGVKINGANSFNFTKSQATIDDAGDYDCIVSGDCGSDTSNIATITIDTSDPAAQLAFLNSKIDFGEIWQNNSKDSLIKSIIYNKGKNPLSINEINLTGQNANSFKLQQITLPIVLKGGDSLSLDIKFTATDTGANSARINFVSNSKVNPYLTLIANTKYVTLSIDAADVLFNAAALNDKVNKKFNVRNKGNTDATISVSLEGDNSNLFTIEQPTGEFKLQKGTVQEFSITYKAEKFYKINVKLKLLVKENNVENVINLIGNMTDVEDDLFVQNYSLSPNPSNNGIEFKFKTTQTGEYSFSVIDANGNLVKDLGKQYINSGENLITWNGLDYINLNVNSGVYYFILKRNEQTKSFKFIIAK